MDITAIAAILLPLAFVLFWLVGLFKDITNGNGNGVVTRLTAFAGAFIVVNLAAHSVAFAQRSIGNGLTFGQLAWGDLLLVSLVIAAGGGGFSDYLRAKNPADGTVMPSLLPNTPPAPVTAVTAVTAPVVSLASLPSVGQSTQDTTVPWGADAATPAEPEPPAAPEPEPAPEVVPPAPSVADAVGDVKAALDKLVELTGQA